MSKIVIDIFMYIFEAVMMFHYGNTVFGLKSSKGKSFLYITLANIVLCVVYQFNVVYINGILLFLLYVLIFASLYNTTLKEAIFHSGMIIIIMFASELLVMGVGTIFFKDFNAMDNEKSAYLFVIVTSKIIYFTILNVLIKFFSKKHLSGVRDKYFWILLIVPITSIFMLLSFRYVAYEVNLSMSMQVLFTASSILVLLSNLLIFVIYQKSLENINELYDMKVTAHKAEQDKKYFEVIEQSNKDMRIFVHDLKNHLTQINSFNDVDNVHSYIENLMPTIDRFTYLGVSKNKMLDLIISKYITLCESKNIKFSIDAKTSNLSYVDDVDLSIIFNNLLDNAIEAAEKSKERFIDIHIFSKNDMFDGVIIKNSCDVKPISRNDNLQTTKQDFKDHGLGVSSVKRVLKKYNALYDWKYIECTNTFETNIVFTKNIQ